jgi:hypothetical protein
LFPLKSRRTSILKLITVSTAISPRSSSSPNGLKVLTLCVTPGFLRVEKLGAAFLRVAKLSAAFLRW